MKKKERLKIAFLDSWFLDQSRGSGTTVAIRGLSEALISIGCSVDIISPSLKNRSHLLRRLFYNFFLRFRIKEEKYDAIIGCDIDGCFFHPKKKNNFYVLLNGIAAEEAKYESGFSRFILWFLSILEKKNVSKAKKVFVPSLHSQNIAMKCYKLSEEKLSVIPIGISVSLWDEIFTKKVNRKVSPPYILSVARQYPRKNTSFLISAMKDVVKHIPNAKLFVIGGGPMVETLRAQVFKLQLSENIEILGEISNNQDVIKAYEEASLFCLPSLQEGFGIVFLEAMCAGLPIVAVNISAVPEVLGDSALLVEENDLQGLADSIVRILKDDDFHRTLQLKGRKRVENFDWSVVAKRFLESLVV